MQADSPPIPAKKAERERRRLAVVPVVVALTCLPGTNDLPAALSGQAQRAQVLAVSFSRDGQRVLAVHSDGTGKWWSVVTGQELGRFATVPSVDAVAIGGGAEVALVAVGEQPYGLQLWDAAAGTRLRTWDSYWGVSAVTIAADGERALIGTDLSVSVLNLATGTSRLLSQQRPEWRGNVEYVPVPDPPSGVAVSRDGRRGVSAHYRTLRIWDLATGTRTRSMDGGEFTVIAFLPDGRRLLCGDRAGDLTVWSEGTAAAVRTFRADRGPANGGPVTALAVSGDGARALSGSRDGTLKLWNVVSGEALRTLAGHAGEIRSVAFSADGRLAVSGGADGTTRLWDLPTGRQVARLPR